MKKKVLLLGIGAFVLTGLAAGAGAYFTQQSNSDSTTKVVSDSSQPKSMQKTAVKSNADMPWKNGKGTTTQQKQVVQPQQQQATDCNDNNIIGMAAGAILGGVAGNQIGKGSGKTAATIGGTVGGAYLGQQMIPTNGVACR